MSSPLRYVLRGARHVASIPALVLIGGMIGFAALAREAGYTLGETMFLTICVWALPSQVVFIGIVGSGASMAAVMLAVGLSAVRFMPMTMAWTPLVRGRDTSRLSLLVLSWFVAITSWVFAMARLPEIPRESRIAFFAGFAVTLTLVNVALVGIAYMAIGTMPPTIGAALVFLMPIYFLMALWGAARHRADRLALGAGLVLGPVFGQLAPEVDLLLAGLVGGSLAYGAARLMGRS